MVVRPPGDGPYPGVVLGAEAYGINPFILDVQERLVGLGYVATVPDYYHGRGPANRESYEDFAEVTEHISRLDFTCGARDLARAVDAEGHRTDLAPALLEPRRERVRVELGAAEHARRPERGEEQDTTHRELRPGP